MLLDGINLELKRLITKFQTPLISTTKTIFARKYGTASCCNFIQFERNSAPRSPSSMLDRQKPDVGLQGANIETGGGREGGKNVSLNGIVQPNACEN